jgi:hypothetical protein
MYTMLFVVTNLTPVGHKILMGELTELGMLENTSSTKDTITVKLTGQQLQNPGYIAAHNYIKSVCNRQSDADWVEVRIEQSQPTAPTIQDHSRSAASMVARSNIMKQVAVA